MKELSLEQMSDVKGGGNMTDAWCGASTVLGLFTAVVPALAPVAFVAGMGCVLGTVGDMLSEK